MQPILDLAVRSGIFSGAWCPYGTEPYAVIVELDQRRWAVYPAPDGSGNWVVAMCEPDGRPCPGTALWLPLTDADDYRPVAWWDDFLAARADLPELWRGRPAPLPSVRSAAGLRALR